MVHWFIAQTQMSKNQMKDMLLSSNEPLLKISSKVRLGSMSMTGTHILLDPGVDYFTCQLWCICMPTSQK